MKVKVQYCFAGNSKYYFRLLVCGGLRIRCNDGDNWSRSYASKALDLLGQELPGISRKSIRFIHE